MKPLDHARKSVRRYGGVVEDYLDIHEFLDMSKAGHADMRHRMMLHNSMGPYACVVAFGDLLTPTAGTAVSVRQIAEDHILEDMGRIPNLSEFCSLIPEDQMYRFAYSVKRGRGVLRD